MTRLIALLVALLALPGCGLHPLYAGGGGGAVARSLAGVQVEAIGGQSGWLMHNALTDRLSVGGASEVPRYRLQVELDDQIVGLGVRADNAITRERRTLRARYQLVEAQTGSVLLDATAGSDSGIDVVSSDYATVAAEQTALENLTNEVADQIVSRLALYTARTSSKR